MYKFLLLLLPSLACGQPGTATLPEENEATEVVEDFQYADPEGLTIESRFPLPEGWRRAALENDGFGAYLRRLPLKPAGADVRLYNGRTKYNYNVYAAVVDLPIGKRDLHQCADAVMRLWADYCRVSGQPEKIHFQFTNGFKADYVRWKQGARIAVNGNNVSWKPGYAPSDSDQSYWQYLEMVFSYAGTLSLSRELKTVSVDQMQVGDVFIQGGSPGHAVIVVDMAENTNTGERMFMLAQSYMPAQEIQILLHPGSADTSIWYPLDFGETLYTPEWRFSSRDLKRFEGW